jgi:tetratricopeptide (TPR) repeat protein
MTRIETGSELLMEPGNPGSWLSLGSADYEKRDWLNAARYFMRAYITDPRLEDAVYWLANCQIRLGRPKEATDVLEKYSGDRPTSARFQVLHGHTLFALHEVGRALLAFEAARALGVNSGKLERWIGQCHSALVDKDRAIISFQNAVDLEPGRPDNRLLLARVLMDKGELAQARAHCQTVKDGPKYSQAQGILAAINRLEDGGARHLAAPWPRASSLFDDLRRVAREFVLTEVDPTALSISPGSRLVTLGSCFAENLSVGLAAAGLRTKHIGFTEVLNSTYANRYFLDWLFEAGEAPEHYSAFTEYFGDFDRPAMRRTIAEADVFVFTLGVAPCLFEEATGRFTFQARSSEIDMVGLSKRYAFRTTTIEENVENMRVIKRSLLGHAPTANLVYSVSPVPLNATFEYRSAVVADCVSKAVLRGVADQIVRSGDERLIYWPSFEIVRWLGAHSQMPVYGEDGNTRHVNSDLVRMIIDLFVETFGTPELIDMARDFPMPVPT